MSVSYLHDSLTNPPQFLGFLLVNILIHCVQEYKKVTVCKEV